MHFKSHTHLFHMYKIRQKYAYKRNRKQNIFMHHYLLQQEQEQTQQLQLSVKCFNLINEAYGIPLDSYIVVKLIQRNKQIKQLIKSKVYWGCSNPVYEQKINFEFSFKNEQNLLLQVFAQQTKPRLFGWLESTVSKIFGSKSKMIEEYLRIEGKKYSNSKIQIACKKKQKNLDQIMCWKLNVKLNNVQPFRNFYFFTSKQPIFFMLTKSSKSSQTLLYKSETSNIFSSKQFKQFDVRKKFFQENYTEFNLKVYQGDIQNKKQIGYLTFSPLDLEIKKPQTFSIKNSAEKKVGSVVIQLVQQFLKYTFTDYIDAGLQFKVLCNIDFTASNKKPTCPDSLHRIGGGCSAYEQAMSETLKILLDYDDDKLIPTYGFGAKVHMPNFNSEGKVSHCFPLNGDMGNPNIKELDGIIKTYRKSLNYLDFAGPTNFSEIIKNAINQCSTFCSNHSQYMLVFIMTDGQLHDTYPVIDLIDKHSSLPMSIIIIGLGDNDFQQMQKLDGDDQPLLNSRGKKVRDIVQFVDFKQCGNSSTRLAVKILEQLPDQILSYYSANGVTPKKLKQIRTEMDKTDSRMLGQKENSIQKINEVKSSKSKW